MSNKFKRGGGGAKRPGTADAVTIGGVSLPGREGEFLSTYLTTGFNGSESARRMGIAPGTAGVFATQMLKRPQVRSALKNELAIRRDKMRHDADEVARYWLNIALSDPRELTQIIYVPCRHCWGDEHGYQETTSEYDERFDKYELEVARRDRLGKRDRERLDPMPPFERAAPSHHPRDWVYRRFGGTGYTTNRDPMRGPDWVAKVSRIYEQVGRPLPEGVEENSDHSCPECHGDGIRMAWVASTPELSPEAARLYNGVRITRDGIEVKMLDRMDAMRKYAEVTGMVGPAAAQLVDKEGRAIDVDLKRIEIRVIDADFSDITDAALAPATVAEVVDQASKPNGHLNGGAPPAQPVPRVRTVPVDEE